MAALNVVTPTEVDTATIRSMFERSGVTKGELAERMGWMRPNIDKVNRALGFRPDTSHRGRRAKPRTRMTYDLAVRICEALNASPVDTGI